MSKPYIHAKSSARRFGGKPDDYMDIHNEMDCTKSALADVRHRAVYHSAFGIYIIEKIFGDTRTNSAGKTYSVRDIAEQHIMEDLGFIPTLEKWMSTAEIEPWMMGKKEVKEVTHIPFEQPKDVVIPIKMPDFAKPLPTTPVHPLPNIPGIGDSIQWPPVAIPNDSTHQDFPDWSRVVTID